MIALTDSAPRQSLYSSHAFNSRREGSTVRRCISTAPVASSLSSTARPSSQRAECQVRRGRNLSLPSARSWTPLAADGCTQARPTYSSLFNTLASSLLASNHARLPITVAISEPGLLRHTLRACPEIIEGRGFMWRRSGDSGCVGRFPQLAHPCAVISPQLSCHPGSPAAYCRGGVEGGKVERVEGASRAALRSSLTMLNR